MKTTFKRRWLSRLLCLVLLAAVALGAAGCGAAGNETQVKDTGGLVGGETTASDGALSVEDGAELGEGALEFPLTVRDGEGGATRITIHTDRTTVGEALQELGLIAGEEGPYGLYVKTVNGITADYDTDRTYWGFYINGAYAASGVDVTEITAGDEYELAVERG